MAILQTCCCWDNVRTGSIASAIYTIVLSLLTTGLVAITLLQLEILDGDDDMSISHNNIKIALAWFFTTLAVSILLFVTSVILLVAIHKDSPYGMLPWIVAAIIVVIMDTAALIFDCVIFGMLTLNIIQMVVWLALTLLNIYAILCVISQYQELKAGRGTRAFHRQQRPMIMYQPAIQQVHITQGPITMTFPGTFTSSMHINHHQGVAASLLPGHTHTATATADVTTTLTMISPPAYSVANDLPRYSAATGMRSRHASTQEEAAYFKRRGEDSSTGAQATKMAEKWEVLPVPTTPPPNYQP